MHVLETLQQRGFIQQTTGLDSLREALNAGRVTYYVGFDPTAPSLHVGHLMPVYAMAWLQRAGHRPIAIVGGGTAMVGDPSGKTELRQMLTKQQIADNSAALKRQLSLLLEFDDDKGLLVDNAEWLCELNYIDFLRDIGRHFSVNRMLAMEAYKQRLKRGLSFIEFNYQLLQAYDFVEMHRRYGCTLQLGGDDQWGNILAGTDLVRRCDQADAHGLTQPLLMTAAGVKMGKTAKGAVWLDRELMPDFDFYQFWLSVDDRDVIKLLKLYTFLPMARIHELAELQGADIRQAKRVLAREVTALIRGAESADAAERAAKQMSDGGGTADLPTHAVPAAELDSGVKLYALLADAGLAKSRGEARRLIKGGGVRLHDARVTDTEAILYAADLVDGAAVVRVGKKRAARVVTK